MECFGVTFTRIVIQGLACIMLPSDLLYMMVSSGHAIYKSLVLPGEHELSPKSLKAATEYHSCQLYQNVRHTPGFLTIVLEGSRMAFLASIVPEFYPESVWYAGPLPYLHIHS